MTTYLGDKYAIVVVRPGSYRAICMMQPPDTYAGEPMPVASPISARFAAPDTTPLTVTVRAVEWIMDLTAP